MCERNSALRIVTMSNLQMRRSIASISNCITNRMHSQDSESSERLLSVASVTRPHRHCLCPPPTHPSRPSLIRRSATLSTATTISPGSTRNHIHRMRIFYNHLRHTNRAQIPCSASLKIKHRKTDMRCWITGTSTSAAAPPIIRMSQLAIPRLQHSSSCCCRCSSSTARSRVTQTTPCWSARSCYVPFFCFLRIINIEFTETTHRKR